MHRYEKILLAQIIFIITTIGMPWWAFAMDQGVEIGGIPSVRQEIRPFVPIINKNIVLDPPTNQFILLFPGEEVKKRIEPAQPEVKTEKKVIRKTHSETEIGTITIKKIAK